MLVIKTIRDGVIHIYEQDGFAIHLPGSEQYKFAEFLLEKLEKTPREISTIYYTQALYNDEECTEVFRPEAIFFSHRVSGESDKMVGVIVATNPSDSGEPIDEIEMPYEILTEDDEVYVTNEAGKTVYKF